MAAYKCISCVEIKENETVCSCPVCGYKMFEMPYIRTEIIKAEIKNFIEHLMLCNLDYNSFEIFRRVPKKKKQWKR